MQRNYDIETDHSRELVNQLKWDKFIEQELKKLSKFKSIKR